MPLNTRHWMGIMMGGITTMMSSAGITGHDLPSVIQYVQMNALPAIVLAADWINARMKEWKGVTGYATFISALQSTANAIPELKAALDKAGIKLPAV